MLDGSRKYLRRQKIERPDGLYVTGGPLICANGKRTAEFASKSRLPSANIENKGVDAGGLMSDGRTLAESYRRVAYYVDKI